MSLYNDLITTIGQTKFLINDVDFKTLGKIIMIDHNISPPVLKTSKIEFGGINGSIDTTFTIFQNPRYEDRFLDLSFLIVADNREEALSTIKVINGYLGQELKIKKDSNSPFYFAGRIEKGVDYTVAREGILNCQLSFKVFPLSIQNFDNEYLWDDVIFADYYFNDYVHTIPIGGIGTNVTFYLPNPLPPELVVYSSASNLIWNNNISLIKGLNYISVASNTVSPLIVAVKNLNAVPATISISLETGVLEYV